MAFGSSRKETFTIAGKPFPEDKSSFREAIFVLVVWLVAGTWTLTYSYLFGYSDHPRVPADVSALTPNLEAYDVDAESLTTVWNTGIPEWAFWGILVPWGVSFAITFWFCLAFVRDDATWSEEEVPT